MFADYRVVIYENDSQDETVGILRAWQQQDPKVTILSEVLHAPRWGSIQSLERTAQLAAYRNRYRELAIERFHDFDFIVVVDTDLLGWSYDGSANTFGLFGWDAVTARGNTIWHGRPAFYDGWAFRALDHPEVHTEEAEIRSMVFPRGTPPVPVLSSFSGLGVYTMQAMRAARYGGTDCEHVVLHRNMRAAGFGSIFMNPSLITLYPDRHLLHPNDRFLPWWTGTCSKATA
jgi:hypothetical protein